VGIIGRNGSGKSTLLKILSRITAPTEGRAEIHGRVGSLLEVGTGFHPELTGRENIYLNGAVIGIKKAEVARKFNEIVAFSEIEKFLDTPVKRYSSGMYVRLAFAVAAHLEPEILIVDEVLAVGDAQFQKKCLGKMSKVSKEGRTVLFVSHNMGAVNRLCSRSMWLDKGQLEMSGPTEEVVAAYLSMGSAMNGEIRWDDEQDAPGNDCIRLRAVRIRNSSGEVSSTLDTEHPFYVEVDYSVKESLSGARVGISLVTSDGTLVFVTGDTDGALDLLRTREPGMHRSRCRIPGGLLNSGQYSVSVAADIPMREVLFLCENVLPFHMEMVKGPGSEIQDGRKGIIRPKLDWEVN
jgi:lipopolysaccharide transport system ATP-binding protein